MALGVTRRFVEIAVVDGAARREVSAALEKVVTWEDKAVKSPKREERCVPARRDLKPPRGYRSPSPHSPPHSQVLPERRRRPRVLINQWEKADAAAAERLTVEVRRVFSKYDQSHGRRPGRRPELCRIWRTAQGIAQVPAAGGAEDERSNAGLLDLYDERSHMPAGADGVEAECVSREAWAEVVRRGLLPVDHAFADPLKHRQQATIRAHRMTRTATAAMGTGGPRSTRRRQTVKGSVYEMVELAVRSNFLFRHLRLELLQQVVGWAAPPPCGATALPRHRPAAQPCHRRRPARPRLSAC